MTWLLSWKSGRFVDWSITHPHLSAYITWIHQFIVVDRGAANLYDSLSSFVTAIWNIAQQVNPDPGRRDVRWEIVVHVVQRLVVSWRSQLRRIQSDSSKAYTCDVVYIVT